MNVLLFARSFSNITNCSSVTACLFIHLFVQNCVTETTVANSNELNDVLSRNSIFFGMYVVRGLRDFKNDKSHLSDWNLIKLSKLFLLRRNYIVLSNCITSKLDPSWETVYRAYLWECMPTVTKFQHKNLMSNKLYPLVTLSFKSVIFQCYSYCMSCPSTQQQYCMVNRTYYYITNTTAYSILPKFPLNYTENACSGVLYMTSPYYMVFHRID